MRYETELEPGLWSLWPVLLQRRPLQLSALRDLQRLFQEPLLPPVAQMSVADLEHRMRLLRRRQSLRMAVQIELLCRLLEPYQLSAWEVMSDVLWHHQLAHFRRSFVEGAAMSWWLSRLRTLYPWMSEVEPIHADVAYQLLGRNLGLLSLVRADLLRPRQSPDPSQ